jgi:hypothetical protein
MWISLGKLNEIENIIVYANTVDMVWHIGIIKKPKPSPER